MIKQEQEQALEIESSMELEGDKSLMNAENQLTVSVIISD